MDLLPDEILFEILLLLDIPELHALSMTSHRLRRLANDPYLHFLRLHHYCPTRINIFLSLRPAIENLMARHIIISPYLRPKQYDISRKLHRQLITTRLRKRLATRPSKQELVVRHVLPSISCLSVAPALVASAERLEKNMSRQSLEMKILKRPKPQEVAFLGVEFEEEKLGVKGLVRRFSCLSVGEGDMSEGGEGSWVGKRLKRRMMLGKEKPSKAAVWRLRKFWEKMSTGVSV